MITDFGSGAVLLFGGQSASGYMNDTWRFSLGAWTHLTPAVSPSPRSNSSGLYEPVYYGDIVFGGNPGTGASSLNDTWIYRSGTWTNLSRAGLLSGPTARMNAAFAYYPYLSEAVLLGGTGSGGQVLSDEWILGAAGWSLRVPVGPSARAGAMMTNISTGPGVEGPIILFGGADHPGRSFNDTWRYGIFAPIPEIQSYIDAGQSDQAQGLVVGGFPPFGFNWSFGDGTFGSTKDLAHVYQSAGLFAARLTVRDAIGELSTGWNNVTVSPALAVRAASNVTATDMGVEVQLNGTESGGLLPYRVGWNISNGAREAGAPQLDVAFSSAGNFSAEYSVIDSNSNMASAAVGITVHSLPVAKAVYAFARTPIGSATRLQISTSGGTGPFEILWAFGDGASGSGSSPIHVFSAVGNYTVNANLTDAVGAKSSAVMHVLVYQPSGTASLPVFEIVGGVVIASGALIAVAIYSSRTKARRSRALSPPP
jgi:PKD repeat protein